MTGHATYVGCPMCAGNAGWYPECPVCAGAGGWDTGDVYRHRITPEYRCPKPVPATLAIAAEWHWHEHSDKPKSPRWHFDDLKPRHWVDIIAEFVAFGCPTCAPTPHHQQLAAARQRERRRRDNADARERRQLELAESKQRHPTSPKPGGGRSR